MHVLNYNAFGDQMVNLKSVKFVEGEGASKNHYLDITYEVETLSEKKIVRIPKLIVPINPWEFRIKIDPDELNLWKTHQADVGFGWVSLDKDDSGNYYTETVVERKVHEMTISEIEEKLGYKIKIVGE